MLAEEDKVCPHHSSAIDLMYFPQSYCAGIEDERMKTVWDEQQGTMMPFELILKFSAPWRRSALHLLTSN